MVASLQNDVPWPPPWLYPTAPLGKHQACTWIPYSMQSSLMINSWRDARCQLLTVRMGEEVMRGGYSERTGCMSVSAHLEQQPMDGWPEEDQGYPRPLEDNIINFFHSAMQVQKCSFCSMHFSKCMYVVTD
ncbi:uncharacterized protein LOC119290740 [Triticum dicoccoides]|uniref:uncharacterized protein LOC119288134 n=1 Tax=Triticum dicoccoides TaxID=85692 RepID=UPI00188F2354|nr:uncharacterized protein LOC119288134 [Triticum dicoccoides]XP_037425274.1 uncharacterized protein LOC119290740 [Triticum dicoccoides]XP_037425275.1 uncharacterized protein LOC119290740 [Triticum dicoccoides]